MLDALDFVILSICCGAVDLVCAWCFAHGIAWPTCDPCVFVRTFRTRQTRARPISSLSAITVSSFIL